MTQMRMAIGMEIPAIVIFPRKAVTDGAALPRSTPAAMQRNTQTVR